VKLSIRINPKAAKMPAGMAIPIVVSNLVTFCRCIKRSNIEINSNIHNPGRARMKLETKKTSSLCKKFIADIKDGFVIKKSHSIKTYK